MKAGLLLGAALLAALGAVTCTTESDPTIGQSSGDGPAATGAGSTVTGRTPPPCGTLGDSFTDATCGACAVRSCCDELTACDDNEACTDLLDCRAACFDAACVEACTEGHPTGSAGVATLDACLQGPCAEDCPAPVGVCDTGLTLGSEACDTCLGEACCDVLKTCLANETCEVCVTTGEAEGCGEEPLFGDVGACFTESCGDVCG